MVEEGAAAGEWVTVQKSRNPRLKQANAAEEIERSWGVFVLSNDDNVLLLKHKKNNSFWSFSKGGKNGEESDLKTATRELEEETKLEGLRLWMGGEAWQNYSSATEGGDSLEDSSVLRTFVEKYTYKKYRGHPVNYRSIQKEVTFFVAKTQGSASEEDVDVTKSEGEITGYMWVPLDSTRDQVKTWTVIPGSKEGGEGMYDEDLDLLATIKQDLEISRSRLKLMMQVVAELVGRKPAETRDHRLKVPALFC